LTNTPAKSEANIDAAAEIAITNANDPEVSSTSALLSSVEAPIILRRTSKSNPPTAGPIIKANVADASFKLKYRERFPSLVPISARYALETGELPANKPVIDLANKNWVRVPPPRITQACVINPRPLPSSENDRTFLRPTLSERLGHINIPIIIPRG